MGQPEDESQCLEDLMRDLSVADGKSSPFKLFARRAQLVITGLMHISILLLPKPQEDALPSHKHVSGSRNSGSSSKTGSGGGGTNSAGAGSSNGSRGPAAAPHAVLSEMQAAGGFPTDSSDLEQWERVQQLLDRTSASSLDWTNCCVYGLSEERGPSVEPTLGYPVSCTASYYAAHIKGDVLISNDFENKGPHFADWRALYAAGARSMAAAPMYVQQQIVGVLNLASRDPHAFDRSQLVWLMAVVLSPFVSALEFATQRLEMEVFVKRVMPPLLEQNYVRNTTSKRPPGVKGAAPPSPPSSWWWGAALSWLNTKLLGGEGKGAADSNAVEGGGGINGKSGHGQVTTVVPPAVSEEGMVPAGQLGEKGGAAGGRVPLGQPPSCPAGSDQFAHNAEVLITAAAAAAAGGGAVGAAPGGGSPALTPASIPHRSGSGKAGGGRGSRSNGRRDTFTQPSLSPLGGVDVAHAPAPHAFGGKGSCHVDGGKVAVGNPSAASRGGSAPGPLVSATPAAGAAYDPMDPYLSSYDSDLDWGDFFFNLVSMCIVYAYFSEAAVAGESQAAVVVSMCIAAIDILLLALRWLWYEQYITYGGAVLQVFQMYRLVVLPVANTWMSWSLLNKLGITPGAAVVAGIGALVVVFMVLGVQVRFFLHAPLQLASVLFAASSTTDVCSRLLSSTSGVGCMTLVSLLQLSVGVFIPSLMVHVLDMRATDKPYLPHVQAKRWLLHQ